MSATIKVESVSSMILLTVSFEECISAVCSNVKVTNCLKAEINNCTIKGCVGEKGDGGFMSCLMEGRDELKIFNSSMNACNAREDGAKGGGMFLDFSDDSENCYLLEKVSFDSNMAAIGKDFFIECFDLNKTVIASRFLFRLSFENGSRCTDMSGTDRNRMEGKSLDLLLFLIQRLDNHIEISKEGLDIIGCGTVEHPCYSFSRGYKN
ncbi:uncharacterized protein MONOS_8400 [Monocercomonoides exilis]|uniref:uncharacterized protein n=1 Tax=Monocercomonoides exilis TaxID=2049356 RepID=UPI00355A2BAD|nr:hypothetical protein MONOS_8400 [Monocercomonoides exilis]|eukprot:MONOS_8400.1-p1 / transcript=MONOS_8400.1 / gene=MONOS_8400 / organism=Monocercomonoides_exilis_PA203 / gene_product=unspecified product / transcript_product=unspecified product / location=Mono_scaffold00315:47770-48393(-) / protein_length=208 / sequence_SO=supercontig / SO=protein_coding / is_pseudo=false